MPQRFTATNLDLSRFAGFKLVNVDYEQIRAARIAGVKARFEAQGIPYDVDMLETDPAVILEEEDAYRESLDLQAINDAGLGVTLAFAQGTALDLIGTTYFATERLVVAPADPVAGTPAVMEPDDRYRRRIQLAPEAFSGGGTPGGYVYWALTADPRVRDANCYIDAPGTGNVFVSILSTEGDGTVSDELYSAVRATLFRDDVKLATDNLSVIRAKIYPFAVRATLVLPDGISPTVATEAAIARFNTEATARHMLNIPFPREAMASALHVSNVVRVDIQQPVADFDPGNDGATYCTGVTVTTTMLADWPQTPTFMDLSGLTITRKQFLEAVAKVADLAALNAAIPQDVTNPVYIEWFSAETVNTLGPLAQFAKSLFSWDDDHLAAVFTIGKTLAP